MAAPSKRSVLEKLLDQGMVMVHLDARRPGVRVPPAYKADGQLRLNLSYRFQSRDLALNDELVRCTLSFSGQPFYCELPLEAGVRGHQPRHRRGAESGRKTLATALAEGAQLERRETPPRAGRGRWRRFRGKGRACRAKPNRRAQPGAGTCG